MVEMKKCWVQLQRVQVVLKTNEQVQMSTGQMEDDRSKTYGAPGELGLKMAKKRPTELPGRVKVKCDECGKSVSKRHLQNHKRIVHRGETPFTCTVANCGMMFTLPHGVSDHKRVNHGYPKLKCKVVGCGAEFFIRYKFDNHCRTHESKCECDECGKSMTSSYLSTHKQLVHRGEKPHPCKEMDCTERFSSAPGLSDHGRMAHGHPKLKCKFEDCGLELSGYEDLRNHQRNHSRIKCTECGKSVSKKALLNHMRCVHQGERPFECEIDGCDRKFSGKIRVADHMRSVHGSPKLRCSIGECTAEFVYKKHLLVHAKEHLI